MKDNKFNALDYLVLSFAVLSLASNFVLSLNSHPFINPLTSFLMQFLGLVFSVYLAYRLTRITLLNETIRLQKNTAKTAIRHIKGYQRSIIKLIEIIKDKTAKSTTAKFTNDMNDIQNHLDYLAAGIELSENDFQDILGEEIREEHTLLQKIREDMDKALTKYEELDTLRKEEKVGNREKITELKTEIRELRSKIEKSRLNLPLGGIMTGQAYLPTGPAGSEAEVNLLLGNYPDNFYKRLTGEDNKYEIKMDDKVG